MEALESIIEMYALAVIFGFAYRALLKRFAKGTVRGVGQNIGKSDRLLFFSGFCFFEAAFSWCGFYAALGRTTCPVE
jgi:hypothetical protein